MRNYLCGINECNVEINSEIIDEFTIKWRNIPQTEVTSLSEEE